MLINSLLASDNFCYLLKYFAKCLPQSGSKLFEFLIVCLKDFILKKKYFLKKSADKKKTRKIKQNCHKNFADLGGLYKGRIDCKVKPS